MNDHRSISQIHILIRHMHYIPKLFLYKNFCFIMILITIYNFLNFFDVKKINIFTGGRSDFIQMLQKYII